MPLYEFTCARCNKPFEELFRDGQPTPTCPSCAKSDEVARVPFGGGVSVGRKENLNPPFIKGVRPPRR
jgi:putative FmdB family regulatory protein